MKVIQINNQPNNTKYPNFKGVRGPKTAVKVIKNQLNRTQGEANSFTRLTQSAEVQIKKGAKTGYKIDIDGINPRMAACGVGLLGLAIASLFSSNIFLMVAGPLWAGSFGSLALLYSTLKGRSIDEHELDIQVGQSVNKKKNLTGAVTEPIKTVTSEAHEIFNNLENIYQENLFKNGSQKEVIDYLTKTLPKNGDFINPMSGSVIYNLFKHRIKDSNEILSSVLEAKNPNGKSYFETVDPLNYLAILNNIKDNKTRKQFLLKEYPNKNNSIGGVLYEHNNLTPRDVDLIIQDYIDRQFIKDAEGYIPLHHYKRYTKINEKLSKYPEVLAKLHLTEDSHNSYWGLTGTIPIERQGISPQLLLELNKYLESCPEDLLKIYFHNNSTIDNAITMDDVMDDLINKIKVSPRLMLDFRNNLNKMLKYYDKCFKEEIFSINKVLNKIDSILFEYKKDLNNINLYEIKNLINVLEKLPIKDSKGELLSIPYNENGDNLLCAIADILPKNQKPEEYQKLLDVIQEAPLANYNITDGLGFSFIEKILHSENEQLFDVVKKHRFNYTPTLHETFSRITHPEFKEKVRKELKVSFPDIIQAITSESEKTLDEPSFLEQINSPFFTEETKNEVWDKLGKTSQDFETEFTLRFGGKL